LAGAAGAVPVCAAADYKAGADHGRRVAMFSKDLTMALNSAISGLQQDPTGSQLPAVQHLTRVLRVLWREVERLERSVRVSNGEILLQSGEASIVLKRDGTIVIRGNQVVVEAAADFTAKALRNIVLKGAKILQN
jgi:hypothetical protein